MRSDSPNAPLTALQGRLGHAFADPDLLARALTHRSFSSQHNERLEFLGDSVLNLAVAGLLYERLDSLPEGDLSRVRASMVRQEALHKLALDLDLSSLLQVGMGEAQSGGKRRPSMLADAVEAVIGAVYLDAGFVAAEALVRRLFSKIRIDPELAAAAKDAKTSLQEWLQGRKMNLPVYRVVATTGAAHRQLFDVECEVVELGLSERGIGNSRRAGEQAAASAMLARLLLIKR
ncbi:MAG: ribonuclease III [Burkholderiales bacterium]